VEPLQTLVQATAVEVAAGAVEVAETVVDLQGRKASQLGEQKCGEKPAVANRAVAVIVEGFNRGAPRGTGEAEARSATDSAERTSWEAETILGRAQRAKGRGRGRGER
jgi:hypothetical protein